MYIHYSEAVIREVFAGVLHRPYFEATLDRAPLKTRSITLLVPSAYHLTSAAFFDRWINEHDGGRISRRLSRRLTVVILPWRTIPGEKLDRKVTASKWSAARSQQSLSNVTRYVGAEYIRTDPLDVRLPGVPAERYSETGGLGAPNLYIHLADSYIRSHPQGDEEVSLYVPHLPKSIRAVTLLVPLAYLLHTAPSCSLHKIDAGRGVTMTIVLLPWKQTDETRSFQAGTEELWAVEPGSLSFDSYFHPIQLVGIEHTGVAGDPSSLIPFFEGGADLSGNPSQQLSYTAFSEWVTSLPPEHPFTPAERAILLVRHALLNMKIAKDGARERRDVRLTQLVYPAYPA